MARVCTLNDATLVRLDSLSVRMTMIEMMLGRIFDGCIGVTFERLAQVNRCQVEKIFQSCISHLRTLYLQWTSARRWQVISFSS